MIEWSLDALRACESVRSIVIAIPPGFEHKLAGAGRLRHRLGRCDPLPVGRQRSRRRRYRPGRDPRCRPPAADPRLLEALVARLEAVPEAAGAIAAAPVTDTVKRAADRRDYGEQGGRAASGTGTAPDAGLSVERTVDRGRLWAAQTPQVFRTAALREALAVDAGRRDAATDEAMLIEEAGGTVLLHPSGPENLKVTTPYDLRLAALLLADRAG